MCDPKKKSFLLDRNAQKGAFFSIGIDGPIDKGRHRTVAEAREIKEFPLDAAMSMAASEEVTRSRHVNGGWRGAEGKFF